MAATPYSAVFIGRLGDDDVSCEATINYSDRSQMTFTLRCPVESIDENRGTFQLLYESFREQADEADHVSQKIGDGFRDLIFNKGA